MARPFRQFLEVTLPPILEATRLAIDNAWLDIKADTATITEQIRSETQITFWEMQGDLVMHMFGTRNRIADAWIGIRADAVQILNGMTGQVARAFADQA